MSNGQIPAAQVSDLAAVISAAISSALADLTAADVDFAPTGDLSSTDVQAVVVEVYGAIATQITAALAGLTAADVAFAPAGGISATDVQTALVEVKAAIATQIAALVASAPGTLDTLNELAAALGDDPNFATTITTALAGKLAKASNLSDLTNTSAARTNLGLGTAATKDTGTGAGNIPVLSGTPGTPTGSKFLRDDGTWAVPPGGGGSATTALVPMVSQIGSGDPGLVWTDAGELLLVEVPL